MLRNMIIFAIINIFDLIAIAKLNPIKDSGILATNSNGNNDDGDTDSWKTVLGKKEHRLRTIQLTEAIFNSLLLRLSMITPKIYTEHR